MHFDFIQKLFVWIVPTIFAITLHEVAHGYVAKKLGDNTASMLGRLTINPLKHIDIIGTVIVPLALFFMGGFLFGWAKPVPVDWRNLKNPRRDMALVAVAGPAANILMAIFWAIVARVGIEMQLSSPWIAMVFASMGVAGIFINVFLAVLNMVPIPPLDGSRIVTSFLSDQAARKYNSIERYGFIILLVLLATGILAKILLPVAGTVISIIAGLFGVGI
jgi:Zn-dependent protease